MVNTAQSYATGNGDDGYDSGDHDNSDDEMMVTQEYLTSYVVMRLAGFLPSNTHTHSALYSMILLPYCLIHYLLLNLILLQL